MIIFSRDYQLLCEVSELMKERIEQAKKLIEQIGEHGREELIQAKEQVKFLADRIVSATQLLDQITLDIKAAVQADFRPFNAAGKDGDCGAD